MSEQKVVVVGLGFLGRGIAAALLGHGFHVVGYARSMESHHRAQDAIAQAIREMTELGGFDPSLRKNWPARYAATSSFDALRDCDFVIESVAEDEQAKNVVFDEIERVVSSQVPIASNTSAIPISVLQCERQRPERFLGMHWAEPAYATRFLELIRGERTADAAFERAVELARSCGKEPSIVQKDIPGFIANRLGYAIYREALHLIESGVADAETVDRSFRNAAGLWATLCGPLRWIDLTGGPALYARAMKPVLSTLCNDDAIAPTLAELAASESKGIANGHGFYDYTPEECERWEELFRRHAWAVHQLQNEYHPLERET